MDSDLIRQLLRGEVQDRVGCFQHLLGVAVRDISRRREINANGALDLGTSFYQYIMYNTRRPHSSGYSRWTNKLPTVAPVPTVAHCYLSTPGEHRRKEVIQWLHRLFLPLYQERLLSLPSGIELDLAVLEQLLLEFLQGK
jgi:hypothetical protein